MVSPFVRHTSLAGDKAGCQGTPTKNWQPETDYRFYPPAGRL